MLISPKHILISMAMISKGLTYLTGAMPVKKSACGLYINLCDPPTRMMQAIPAIHLWMDGDTTALPPSCVTEIIEKVVRVRIADRALFRPNVNNPRIWDEIFPGSIITTDMGSSVSMTDTNLPTADLLNKITSSKICNWVVSPYLSLHIGDGMVEMLEYTPTVTWTESTQHI